jgi:hypothetical protein
MAWNYRKRGIKADAGGALNGHVGAAIDMLNRSAGGNLGKLHGWHS